MENELCLMIAVASLALTVLCRRLARRYDRQIAARAADPWEVIALYRGRERYVLIVAWSRAPEAIATVERWAADPDLSLSARDAAAMKHQIQERCKCVPTATYK